MGHLQKKNGISSKKFPYWGRGGGVFPRGNFSHIIPFFVSEDVPYDDDERMTMVCWGSQSTMTRHGFHLGTMLAHRHSDPVMMIMIKKTT